MKRMLSCTRGSSCLVSRVSCFVSCVSWFRGFVVRVLVVRVLVVTFFIEKSLEDRHRATLEHFLDRSMRFQKRRVGMRARGRVRVRDRDRPERLPADHA